MNEIGDAIFIEFEDGTLECDGLNNPIEKGDTITIEGIANFAGAIITITQARLLTP